VGSRAIIKARCGRWLGKVNSHSMQARLEQLEQDSGIEWQAFKIGELFEKINTNNVIKNTFGDLPATTATLSNNQIGKYISRKNATILKNVFSATANGFGKVFYQSKEFTVLQDSYAFKFINSNIKIDKIQSFIVTTLNKVFLKYDWGNKSGWERVKTETIQLPTQNGKIAFEFMEQFIATLQAERLATLQAERLATLQAYLKTTGLTDYLLSDEEQAALDGLETTKWKAFRIEDVLIWQKNIAEINPLHLDLLGISNEKKYPFYGQATNNNGIIEYRHLKDDVLNNKLGKPTILIHSNNQNTVYVDTPFYLKDGHGATSVLQSENLNRITAQFFMASIKKVVMQKYTYNSKATKIELKSTNINLPTLSNQTPDYAYMEVFIKAMQKVVIKNVVDYLEVRINKTASVIK
jgi:hypothetical protein